VSLKSGQIISVVDSMKQITSLEQFVKQSWMAHEKVATSS
jgi:hypothetical protein